MRFDLIDVLVGELVPPALHRCDEFCLARGCPPTANHAVDHGAERGLKEAEDVIDPDVCSRVQLLAKIRLIGVRELPDVEGFPFDIADRVALPQHRGMGDAPPLLLPVRIGLPLLDLPRLLVRKVLEDLCDVVAEGEHREHRWTKPVRQAQQPVQDLNCVERALIDAAGLRPHEPQGGPAIIGRRTPQIGVVPRVTDATIDNVRARIILPFGINRDEGAVLVLLTRLFLFGPHLVGVLATPFSCPFALALAKRGIKRASRPVGRFAQQALLSRVASRLG
jgi:hypothetical protein